MRSNTWTNADGLVVGFGTRDTVNVEAGTVQTKGRVREVEMEVYYDEDQSGTSVKQVQIPAGALIRRAVLTVDTAFAGGTSLQVGIIRPDGTTADTDALITAAQGATANLTANAAITGEGSSVDQVLRDPQTLTVTRTGTFTAGKGTVLVEYVQPSA